MANQQLSELDFTDLYVCLNADKASHYTKLGKGTTEYAVEIPPEFQESVNKLTVFLNEKFVGDEMGLSFEGTRLRAARAKTSSDYVWVALRKISMKPLALEKTGFAPALIPHLHNLGRRDGLILICGATGQGKTTSASSLLSDYLNSFGGVAFTIEDPVEYDMEGRHGPKGYCYQTEVDDDDEWAIMLKRSLRWHPRYIFVGEIRTPDATNQLLRAATSGHLVITTMHSGSIEEALEGLLQLGVQAIGERAPILLATGITAVVHQTFSPNGINAQFFITEPHNPASLFRACIRDKRIGQTRTLIDQQMALMSQGGKIFRDGSN